MIFSLFLTIVFIFMALYSVVFTRTTVIRFTLLLIYIIAIFFVWNPDTTTVVANFFGIGRGLDFILILFMITIMNGMFFIIKNSQNQSQDITKLARYIAIKDTRIPHN